MLVPHTLHIGECVWDEQTLQWGYIKEIRGTKLDMAVGENTRKLFVLLEDSPGIDDRRPDWETHAEDCYQIAEGVTFKGKMVVHEHYRYEMETRYPYYCPDEYCNCIAEECDIVK